MWETIYLNAITESNWNNLIASIDWDQDDNRLNVVGVVQRFVGYEGDNELSVLYEDIEGYWIKVTEDSNLLPEEMQSMIVDISNVPQEIIQ